MKHSPTKFLKKQADQHIDKRPVNMVDMSRRKFSATGALFGASAGAVGRGLRLRAALATDSTGVPKRTGASGFKPLEVDSPMARWKKPQSLEFVTGATERFSFPNWQSGNEDSIYYNLNTPSFFKSRMVPPADEFSVLDRAIQRTC